MHWKVCIKWLAVSWQGVVWAEGQRWTSSCAMLDACLMVWTVLQHCIKFKTSRKEGRKRLPHCIDITHYGQSLIPTQQTNNHSITASNNMQLSSRGTQFTHALQTHVREAVY